MRVINEKINFFLLFLIFIFLWLGYLQTFYIWSYHGYELNFSFFRCLLNIFIFIFFSNLFLKIRDLFFKSIILFLYVYTVLPSMIYYQYNQDMNFSAVGGNLILVLCLYFFSFINIKIKLILFKMRNYDLFLFIFFSLSLLIYILYFKYPKFSFNFNSVSEIIYQIRLYYREIDGTTFLNYYYGPLTRVFIPFLLIYSLIKKNYFLSIFSFVALLYLFSLGALKSILLGYLLIFIFYFGKDYSSKINFLLLGVIFLCVFSLLEYLFLDSHIVNDYIIRRVFFLPNLLHEVYSNFFESNFQYWSHTFLFDALSPFNKPITYFIGEDVMGKVGANANVGIITEGYFSAGYLGILIHCMLVAFIFKVIAATSFKHQYVGILFYYCYLLNTSFLFPLLVTHGFLTLLLISFFKLSQKRLVNYEKS